MRRGFLSARDAIDPVTLKGKVTKSPKMIKAEIFANNIEENLEVEYFDFPHFVIRYPELDVSKDKLEAIEEEANIWVSETINKYRSPF